MDDWISGVRIDSTDNKILGRKPVVTDVNAQVGPDPRVGTTLVGITHLS